MILIFKDGKEIKVHETFLLKIPYFQALMRSSMKEVNENKIEIESDLHIYKKFMHVFFNFSKDFKQLKSNQVRERLKKFFISHVTAKLTLKEVKQYYMHKDQKDLVKRIKKQMIIEMYEKYFGDELEQVRELADRWCCSGVVKICDIIKKKKERELYNWVKYMMGTCAHYFGSFDGCKYGKSCRYSHTCPVEDRLTVIEKSKMYLDSKTKNMKKET